MRTEYYVKTGTAFPLHPKDKDAAFFFILPQRDSAAFGDTPTGFGIDVEYKCIHVERWYPEHTKALRDFLHIIERLNELEASHVCGEACWKRCGKYKVNTPGALSLLGL